MTAPSEQPAFELAGGFPAASAERWRELVDKVLTRSGIAAADSDHPEAALRTRTYDGIDIEPLYTADTATAPLPGVPGLPPYVRGATPADHVDSGWDVRQWHTQPDPKRANADILADLEHGATSTWLAVDNDGITGVRPRDLSTALDGVLLDLAPVILSPGSDPIAAAEALLEVYDSRGISPDSIHGNLGADPLGAAARTGEKADLSTAVALGTRVAAGYPQLRALVADGLPYHDAGASDAQELATATATGLAYVRALVDAGVPSGRAFALIEFRYAATADQFATIAKLRAARRIWARIAQVSEATESTTENTTENTTKITAEKPENSATTQDTTRKNGIGQRQHAVTSAAMLTQRDPWTNMLRTTIACLAAGLGGADAVTVLPFDHAIGMPDAFARRIARNTQALLLAESHLARVIDPAGGSWYVETRTDQLARAAWSLFQEIESAGGMAVALDSGLINENLAATRAKRDADIRHRRTPITGVSEFPDLDEKPLTREAQPARTTDGGLPTMRYAGSYERLRDAADQHLAATGTRPTVFLATLGPIAAHTARATFARNLLSAGGIQPIDGGPLDSPTEAATAYAGSGAKIACVCGNDGAYAEIGAAVANALAEAGADAVLVAGKPGAIATDETKIGPHLYRDCDAIAVLEEIHHKLGVRR